MSPHELALLQKSWGRFVSHGNDAGISFYKRMFAAYPSIRPLFGEGLHEQALKLMNMLNIVINGMHNLAALEESLLELGAKHRQYGVEDEHYVIVGECLLATLEEGLDEEFTEEVRAAWVRAYEIIADIMMRGARALEA